MRRLDASGANTDNDKITFFNDLNGNRMGNDANETISFYVDGGNLVRKQGSAAAQTLTPLGPGGLLEIKYFDKATGAEITTPSTANENTIGMVRIKLYVAEDSGGLQQADARQELITNAALRNRGI